jgi:hypothetical protein
LTPRTAMAAGLPTACATSGRSPRSSATHTFTINQNLRDAEWVYTEFAGSCGISKSVSNKAEG